MAEYNKPLPVITPMNRPYWEAARQHELKMPRCKECGKIIWPIAPRCQECWSTNYEWVHLSGRGTLSSWVVYHQAFHPGYVDELPYHVAEVDLEEGPRLVTHIVGADVKDLKYKMPVEVCFDDVTPEITLPKFRPVKRDEGQK
jgi:uncharacterized OB-fold protein